MKYIIVVISLLLLFSHLFAQDKAEDIGNQKDNEFDLEKCITYGLANKASLKAKFMEKEAANELRQNATKQLLPNLSINANLDHYWQIPVQAFPAELAGGPEGEFIPVRVGTPWNLNAGISTEIDLINASKWKEIRVANLRQQMNTYEFEQEEALLRQQITLAYYNAQLASQQAYFLRQNFDVQQSVFTYVKARFDEGVVEQIDFNRAEAALLNVESQWISSQKNADNQKLALKYWMGMSVDEPIQLVDLNWETDMQEASQYDSLYLNSHPAYQALQSQVLLSESQMEQVGMSRLPKLTAYAGYSQLAFRNAFDFFDGSHEWYSTGQLGLRLNIPIFSRGQIAGDVRINHLQLSQAQKRLSDFELEKRMEYQQLLNDLQTSEENIDSQERQLTLAQENQKIARVKYESGIYSFSDFLEVQREVLQFQRNYLEAFSQYYAAQAELNYLLQK